MNHHLLTKLSLLITLLMFLVSFSDAFRLIRHKKTVNITNDLDIGDFKDLILHCKSKNDDLGEHELVYKDSYSFTFRPDYWRTSQFFCFFKWEENNKNRTEWFDIYIDERDKERGTICYWNIESPGPCMLNEATSKFDICFPWNPK
ncbi:S-protein homolog 19-like [Mercurialis annua]|uniref:S-protein homolog 19-like n=1 Tax=Mercurialis annua TaxID=3986 RepID=UPI00215E1D9D|nr:S-protein homolog 19-like [Mercurialis annua]